MSEKDKILTENEPDMETDLEPYTDEDIEDDPEADDGTGFDKYTDEDIEDDPGSDIGTDFDEYTDEDIEGDSGTGYDEYPDEDIEDGPESESDFMSTGAETEDDFMSTEPTLDSDPVAAEPVPDGSAVEEETGAEIAEAGTETKSDFMSTETVTESDIMSTAPVPEPDFMSTAPEVDDSVDEVETGLEPDDSPETGDESKPDFMSTDAETESDFMSTIPAPDGSAAAEAETGSDIAEAESDTAEDGSETAEAEPDTAEDGSETAEAEPDTAEADADASAAGIASAAAVSRAVISNTDPESIAAAEIDTAPVDDGDLYTEYDTDAEDMSEDDLISDDLVEPGTVEEDQVDINEEYITEEIPDKPKEKPNIFKYIVIAIGIAAIAIVAAMMFRTKLLQTQLDMGRGYLEAEQWDDATNTFNQALKIFHNSADAYLGLAQASIGRGELTEAIQILEKGIQETGSENLEKSRVNIMDQVFATYVMNEYMINILPGESEQLTMTNRSEDMNFSVTWSSDDPSVGTVDETGLVTAVRNGKATIVATIGNDIWGYRDVTAQLIVGVIVTYLEEAGCDYVDDASALTAPCFVYQEDKEGFRIYDGTLEIEQGNATYSLTKCEASDPDVDGLVTYDIEYQVTVPTRFGILADSKESKYAWYYNWMISEMLLCDDYTGKVFAVQDLYGSDDIIYDSTVNWNDTEYHITGTTENEWINEEEWAITFSPLTAITWAEAPAIGTYKLKVKVPKEYQGLVLALDKKGTTDYVDPEFESEEEYQEYEASKTFTDTYFFDPLEDGSVRNAADFYIIRLADFVKRDSDE